MAGVVLIPIIGLTLAEAGKAIGVAALSWASTKVFQAAEEAVMGKTDANADVKAKLDGALKRLGTITTSIKGVSVQIRDLRIDTKTDHVQEHVDDISALYDQYTIAATALVDAAAGDSPDPDEYDKCVNRCTKIGAQVIEKVYPALVHIHTALVEQGDSNSLLSILHAAHVADGKDFLAQYCLLKAALLRYFLVEAQAIVMLDLARQDDTVAFSEVEHKMTMDKIWTMVTAQQAKFDSLLHPRTRELAEQMCREGNERTMVALRAHDGTNIGRGLLKWTTKASMVNWVVRPIISPGYRWILGRFGAGTVHSPDSKGSESQPDPVLDDTNMGADHWFSVTPDINGPELRSLNGGEVSDDATTYSWTVSASRYKLHPTPEGLFRLEHEMHYGSGTIKHSYLEVGTDGLLHDRAQPDAGEPRQKFQIELWDMTKAYDPEAKTAEQHDLEGDNLYWDKPKKDEGGCICM